MARKPTVVDNSDMVEFLSCYNDYSELSGWMDDCFVGSASVGYSNPSSSVIIFHALRTLPVIDLSTAERFVNNKSRVVFGREYGRSHVYDFMNKLIAARKSLIYHYETRTQKSISDFYHTHNLPSGDFVYADGVPHSEISYLNLVSNTQNQH